MCGIVGGFWADPPDNLRVRFEKALAEMRYRGPDDRGFDLFDTETGVLAMGHTRLAIIDLSSAGHQPMVSVDHRFSLVFNGEIYNYRELRTELASFGYLFVSDSDTEVLLAAWSFWGFESLRRLEGMFSFVIHDRIKRTLHCVRDGFGIKPLFYSCHSGTFQYASTLAALLCIKNEKPGFDWQRSYDYLVHGDYDSNSRTFVDGVSQVPPGHYVTFDLQSANVSRPICWWKPKVEEQTKLTFGDATELLRELFLQNIRLHLRSDVTLGAALSGGIDSSAIVCAMRFLEPDAPIKTFSYVASGSAPSEEAWVDRINTFVQAQPHKVTADSSDLLSDLDDMILSQGEPFGSTSIYAQYRVFRLAKQQGVTVTLEGQGADELLAGYSGYPGYRLISLFERDGISAAYRFAKSWSRWPGRGGRIAALDLGRNLLPNPLYALSRKISGRDFRPKWLDVGMMEDSGVSLQESRPRMLSGNGGRRVVEQLARSLQERGLPSLLRHSDRNSMRFSVESRVPFLTPRMADLLLSMPEKFLISNDGETKCVFRAAMRGIVPDEVLSRRDKIGFATPEKDWLFGISGTLRDWIVSADKLAPFIQKAPLLKAFDDIVEGRKAFSWQLWRWINFIRWSSLNGLE